MIADLMDKNDLIQSACKGDLEAFNGLVISYQDLVFRQAVWTLGERKAAEEVTQETFLMAYRKLRSFRNGDFACWLLKIVTRLGMEELHRQKSGNSSHQKTGDDDCVKVDTIFCENSLMGSPEGFVGQTNLAKTLLEGLEKLSFDLRTVITLVDLQEMDSLQTAEILGISVRDVKRNLARARGQLREMLFDPSDEEMKRKEQTLSR